MLQETCLLARELTKSNKEQDRGAPAAFRINILTVRKHTSLQALVETQIQILTSLLCLVTVAKV